MYRCEEAARRGIAYCGRSTIASTSGVDQEVSVHHAEPQGGANMPPSNCTPGEKHPAVLADCGQKSPAEDNQPSNLAVLPATPEEAKETSSQHSVSLGGSSSCSYESNEGSTLPEEYCKFRSQPGDPHSDCSTSESDGSPSEEDREDVPVQLEQHQPESLTILDDLEDNEASTSSPETCTQLRHTRLESSSSPCSEETEDDDHSLSVVREGSPNRHSSESASPSYSEEEEEDDEYMPVVEEHGGGRLERLATHQLDPGVIDLSAEDKVCA